MSDIRERVTSEFKTHFGEPPKLLIRAPGRVNLIGDHTDYNEGFVLPMTIDRAVWLAIRPRADDLVIIHSLDIPASSGFNLTHFVHSESGWSEYIKGMTWALQTAGFELRGFEGVMTGNIPIGAGLSSSAALEMVTARAFMAVSGLPWVAADMAKLAQMAENVWVGVECGIMDQLISAAGQADHALFIDCRDLRTQAVPLPEGTVAVVLDTATRRGLVGSAYNERREQCEAVAKQFGVDFLRDVTLAQLEARAAELTPVLLRRARHVISENERVLQAVEAMERDDPKTLGRLMNASHASLRDDFEVSSEALNAIVELARPQPGCYGARLTGAGFGGCAVALVKSEATAQFTQNVTAAYAKVMKLEAQIYICRATAGAHLVE